MAKFDVVVTVTKTFKLLGVEAADEQDLYDLLDDIDANDEWNAGAEKIADEVLETESEYDVDSCDPSEEVSGEDSYDDEEN